MIQCTYYWSYTLCTKYLNIIFNNHNRQQLLTVAVCLSKVCTPTTIGIPDMPTIFPSFKSTDQSIRLDLLSTQSNQGSMSRIVHIPRQTRSQGSDVQSIPTSDPKSAELENFEGSSVGCLNVTTPRLVS